MSRWNRHLATIAGLLLLPLLLGGDCAPVAPGPMPGGDPPGGDPPPGPGDPFWSFAFDTTNVGALSSVWGTGPTNVFVVGGRTTQGEIYHYDGSVWRAMTVPNVPLLVWVYGFGPNDVFAVGLGGGIVRYNGAQWSKLNSGTTEALWGIWGTSSSDMWIVGGTVGQGDPLLIHYNGQTFTPVPVPPNDRAATSLFKIWGVSSRIIAVGENGLIIERLNGQWRQVSAGPNADDDFVSLWGTENDNIVAVGGRASARIATYAGNGWTTYKPEGRPGLNATFMNDPDFSIVGGVGGYVGRFERGAQGPVDETSPTTQEIHAIWGDGAGRYYAVGGRFSPPFQGLAMVRTLGDPGIDPVPPVGVGSQCASDASCNDSNPCTSDRCIGGDCVHDPIDCDDGDPCTDDSCNGGVCAHTPVVCDDGDPCTTDACDGGDCVYTPIDCADADLCTVDACVDGSCTHTPMDCDDGDPCTVDACNNGVCTHGPLCGQDEICVGGNCEPAPDCFIDDDCVDGDPCTINQCIGGACVFSPMVCDDGDPCTVDACVGGSCVFTPIDCDDGDPCTVDSCGLESLRGDFNQDCVVDIGDLGTFVDVVVGADGSPAHQARADMDGSGTPDGLDIPPFIESVIQGAACDSNNCIHTPVLCDDGDPCTTDACIAGNCEFTDIPGCACDFETDCELGENCVGGLCVATTVPDLQVGIGAGTLGCITSGFEPFEENGLLQICEGFQGFTEVWLSIRATGFPPNAPVAVTKSLSYVGADCTTTLDCTAGLTCVNDLCSPTPQSTVNFTMVDIGGGVNQIAAYGFAMFFSANTVDNRDVVLTITVKDVNNPSIQATQAYHLTIFVRRICFGPNDCDPGQTCVSNYCAPD
jgi:hypothetical protein